MANIDLYKSLLCELLGCGYLDLQMFDDADEDFVVEAIDDLRENRCEITLNGIFEAMFWKVQSELREAVETRINDLECYENSDAIDDDEKNELEKLRDLEPDEDITYYLNYLDTHIYISDRTEGIYREYFSDTIDTLENKMGFCFE